MPLVVLGLSHHSSPVEVRERVALPFASATSLARELLFDLLYIRDQRHARNKMAKSPVTECDAKIPARKP